MAVQRPEVSTALSNWQQRVNFYGSLGIQPSQYYQIAQQDVQNVATGVSQYPMSTAEVNTAMAAQLAGKSLLEPTPAEHHHRGIFGDILHTVTSVPSDIGKVITGFPAGIAHFVAHLPSETTGTLDYLAHTGDEEWLQAHGYETTTGSWLHHFAADLANMSHTPLLALLPGVSDAGMLTTAAGRNYLSNHPITALLDVAPAGRIIGAGARLTSTLTDAERATIADVAAKGGTMKQAERALQRLTPERGGTSMSALRAGQPFRAAYRATTAGIRAISPEGSFIHEMSTPEALQSLANRMGYSQDVQNMLTGVDVTARNNERKMLNVFEPLRQAFQQEAKKGTPVDDARMAELWDEATGIKRVTQENEHLVRLIMNVDKTFSELRQERYRSTGGREGELVVPYGDGRLRLSAGDKPIKSWKKLGEATQAVIKAYDDLQAAKAKLRVSVGIGSPNTQASVDAVNMAIAKLAQARKDHVKADDKFNKDLHAAKTGELGGTKEMGPLTEHMMQQRIAANIEDRFIKDINDPNHPNYDPTLMDHKLKNGWDQVEKDLSTLESSSDMSQIKMLLVDAADRVSPEARAKAEEIFEQMRMDVVSSVLSLIHKGLAPVWIKKVDPGKNAITASSRIHTLPDHISNAETFRHVVNNFSPGEKNVALGLLSTAKDMYEQEATEQMFRDFILHKAWSGSDVENDAIKLAGKAQNLSKRKATQGIKEQAAQIIRQSWAPIRPEEFGMRDWPGGGKFTGEKVIYIPKGLHHHLQAMMDKHEATRRIPMRGTYDKMIDAFEFSVLTGPRHLVHVALGGLFALMLQEPVGPAYFKRMYNTVKRVRAGEDMGPLLNSAVQHLYDQTDGIAGIAIGKTYRNLLMKYWDKTGKNVERGFAHLEEMVSDIYRGSAMLAAKGRGMTDEEAMAIGNKVIVSMDGMTPFERTVVKQIIPFYGFTRYLFKYLLTYPVDHPYRAAMIAQFSTQEQEDWNSLIPEKFMMTLFLGHPDAHGNIKSIDLRNLNPFRSFSNDFTLAGFFSNLNPVIGGALAFRGFDPLTATGQLYPSLEYNVASGTLQAAPPPAQTGLFQAAEQFIPELGALDHFIGITDSMRILKRSNPAAYQAQLYSQLNLPGILAPPVTVNLPYVQERSEMDRYKVANQAVQDVMAGRTSPDNLYSFQYVPYQGQLYTPAQFIAYWKQLQQTVPAGYSPTAFMATPYKKASQDPLSVLAAQGGEQAIQQAQAQNG